MSLVEIELPEQPAWLERFLAAETAHATEIARGLVHDDIRYLLIVSRGSSSTSRATCSTSSEPRTG